MRGLRKIEIGNSCTIHLALVRDKDNIALVVGVLFVDNKVTFLELLLLYGAHRLNRELFEVSSASKNETAIIVFKEDILLLNRVYIALLYYLSTSLLAVLLLDFLQLRDYGILELDLVAKKLVDVFPLVPVTPIIFSFFDGLP